MRLTSSSYLAYILHALPAFYGVVSPKNIHRINVIFRKTELEITADEFKWTFCPLRPTLHSLFSLGKIGNGNQSLYRLPSKDHGCHGPRTRLSHKNYHLRPEPISYDQTPYSLSSVTTSNVPHSILYHWNQSFTVVLN